MSEELTIPKYPIVQELALTTAKIAVIGDVHGCIEPLERLLVTIEKLSKNVTIIFLGDLIDRGLNSADVVKLVRQLTAQGHYCLQGNHSERHVRYEHHQRFYKTNPMKVSEEFLNVHNSLDPSDFEWMAELPHVLTWKDWIFTHAGLIQGWEFKQPTKGLIRNRYIKKEGSRWVPVKTWQDENGVWRHPTDSVHWTDAWDGHLRVVYGHEPRQEVSIKNGCFGIDTGCCYQGKLTAMILDTENKTYYFASERNS